MVILSTILQGQITFVFRFIDGFSVKIFDKMLKCFLHEEFYFFKEIVKL